MKKILYIIIPILTFLIFNLNVKAESTYFNLSLYGNNNFSQTSSFMKYHIFTLYLDKNFTGDSEDVIFNFYYRLSSQDKGSYIVYRDEVNNRYFISLQDTTDTYNINISENNTYSVYCQNCVELYSGISGVTNQSSVTTPTFTTNNGYIFYGKWGFSSTLSTDLGLYVDNYKIIDTNIENLTINNIPWQDYYSPYPSNYQEIDMLNKYAVLFYPKDYRILEKKCTSSYIEQSVETDEEGNVTILENEICTENSYNFNFYYKGNFQYGLTDLTLLYDLNDTKEISSTDFISLDIKSSINGFNGGIIFYNTTTLTNTDEEGNVIYLDKQQANLMYNTDLFNYIIIENKEDIINQNISYIDSNGNNQDIFIYSQVPDKNSDSSLKLDSNLIGKYDFSSNFKNFFITLKNPIEFLSYNLQQTFSGIPSIFIILITLMLLWLLAKKFILK